MLTKTIILNIFCSKGPCELTILSHNNKVITQTILQAGESKICIRTRSCMIKILAKYNGETILQTFCIRNRFCQKIFTSFVFSQILPPTKNILITLTDRVYGLPIGNAILRFKQ